MNTYISTTALLSISLGLSLACKTTDLSDSKADIAGSSLLQTGIILERDTVKHWIERNGERLRPFGEPMVEGEPPEFKILNDHESVMFFEAPLEDSGEICTSKELIPSKGLEDNEVPCGHWIQKPDDSQVTYISRQKEYLTLLSPGLMVDYDEGSKKFFYYRPSNPSDRWGAGVFDNNNTLADGESVSYDSVDERPENKTAKGFIRNNSTSSVVCETVQFIGNYADKSSSCNQGTMTNIANLDNSKFNLVFRDIPIPSSGKREFRAGSFPSGEWTNAFCPDLKIVPTNCVELMNLKFGANEIYIPKKSKISVKVYKDKHSGRNSVGAFYLLNEGRKIELAHFTSDHGSFGEYQIKVGDSSDTFFMEGWANQEGEHDKRRRLSCSFQTSEDLSGINRQEARTIGFRCTGQVVIERFIFKETENMKLTGTIEISADQFQP